MANVPDDQEFIDKNEVAEENPSPLERAKQFAMMVHSAAIGNPELFGTLVNGKMHEILVSYREQLETNILNLESPPIDQKIIQKRELLGKRREKVGALIARMESGENLLDPKKLQISAQAVLANWAAWGISGGAGLASLASHFTSADPLQIPLIGAYAAYEATPGLGGLHAIILAIYSVATYTMPQTVASIKQRNFRDIPFHILRGVGNLSELGFVTMPFLSDDKLSNADIILINRATAHSVKQTIKNLIPQFNQKRKIELEEG